MSSQFLRGGFVRVVHHRMVHHAQHSGYDRLVDYLSGAAVLDPHASRLRVIGNSCVATHIARRAPNRWLDDQWYDGVCLGAELAVLMRRYRLTHFLYGEDQIWLSTRWRGLGGARLATFHQPPGVFDSVFGQGSRPRADFAIGVASNQRDHLAKLVGRDDRVHIVPLGVDTEFFAPDAQCISCGPLVCLTVGSWLRDVGLLRRVAEHVTARRGQDVRFVFVASPPPQDVHSPAITVDSGVSEERLRSLYRLSTVFFHPVTDATANCGLVEAMACGLPIVASDVGGVGDYLTPECGGLVPNDVDAMATAIETLLDDEATRRKASTAARERALSLTWPTVAAQIEQLYRDIVL